MKKHLDLFIELYLLASGTKLTMQALFDTLDIMSRILLTLVSILAFSITIVVNVEKSKHHIKSFLNRFKRKK